MTTSTLRQALFSALLCAGAATQTACSDDDAARSGGTASADSSGTYYQAVQPILAAKCRTCHTRGGIAPFPLETYDDAVKYAAAIKQSVTDRIMPPWMAAPGVREYRFDASLSEAQITTIQHWVDAKLPKGDKSNPGAALVTETIEPIRADVTLELAEPYTPVIAPNEYRCFVLDWPYDHAVYITAFDARPGNAAIVHHLQAYLATPSDVALVQQFDAADPAPGYTCFGAPNPAREAALPVGMLGGWTPGRGALPLPAGTGIRIEPGSKVILQIHYHAAASADALSDASSLIMSVEESVANPGHYIPWMNSEWAIDPKSMLIPAGAAETTHAYRAKPEASLVFNVFSGGAKFPNGILRSHRVPARAQTRAQHRGCGDPCAERRGNAGANPALGFRLAARIRAVESVVRRTG